MNKKKLNAIFENDIEEESLVPLDTNSIYNNNAETAVADICPDLDHPRFGYADYSTIISSNLNTEYKPFSLAQLKTQVAGHGVDDNMIADDVPGILITSEGHILKPIQDLHKKIQKGLTEVAFYSHITKSNDPIDKQVREFIPHFFGIHKLVSNFQGKNNIRNYIILEDITEGYDLPAVMDVKIGRKVYGPDADAKRRAKLDGRNLGTRYPLGYSISGILSHSLKPEDEAKNDIPGRKYNKKEFGLNLTTDTVWKVPEAFYDSQYSGKVSIVNNIFVKKLKELLHVFELQSRYHIYGSSLLLAYDVNAVRRFLNGKIQEDVLEKFTNVKLIDFANVYESNGETDDNFLFGFKHFLALFDSYMEEE